MLFTAPGAYAAAQTRIGLNGGRPAEWPILSSVLANSGLTQEGWLNFASNVGENWLPGTTPVPVDYPAQLGPLSGPSALTTDQSVAIGQRNLHAAILRELANGEPVVVAGLSMGTLVIDRELAYLTTASDAPAVGDVTFYVFGDPGRGFGQMYMSGMTIPFVGQTFHPIAESQYDVVVVMEQWDGWANPPDRPWNLLAVVNAVMGAVYTVSGTNDHSRTSVDSMSDAVQVSQTVNSRGGMTTTYMIPRDDLPITRPLRQIGVPSGVVDEVNKLLMPLIAAGYSSMTPHLGPRIDHGRLVWQPQAPTPRPTLADRGSDVTPPTDDSPVNALVDSEPEADAPAVVEPGVADEPSTTDATPLSDASQDVTDPVDPPKRRIGVTKAKETLTNLDEAVKKVTAGVDNDTDEKNAASVRNDTKPAKPAADSDDE